MSEEKKQNKLLFLVPVGCCVVLILMVLLLSGCQTSSIDDLGVGTPRPLTLPDNTPVASTQPVEPVQAVETVEAIEAQPLPGTEPAIVVKNTGEYPVIGRSQVGETRQLTKADTAAIRQELRQASESRPQKSGANTPAQFQKDLEALRNKAKSHGKDALKKIEGTSG